MGDGRNDKKYVTYESVYVQMNILEDRLGVDVAYRFRKAIDEYGLFHITPPKDSDLWLYGLEAAITSISHAQQRYEASVENGKLGGRPKAVIDVPAAIKMHDGGMTWAAVAKELGVNVDTLRNARKEYEMTLSNETEKEVFAEKPKNLNKNKSFSVFPAEKLENPGFSASAEWNEMGF